MSSDEMYRIGQIVKTFASWQFPDRYSMHFGMTKKGYYRIELHLQDSPEDPRPIEGMDIASNDMQADDVDAYADVIFEIGNMLSREAKKLRDKETQQDRDRRRDD